MIHKSALLLFKTIDSTPHVMMVRSYKNSYLLLPGGKQEPGETIEQALYREIKEELATTVTDIVFVDKISGHTPDGRSLTMSLFTGSLQNDPRPSSEIKEIVWINRDSLSLYQKDLTPITTKEIFPCLARHNLF